MMGGDVAMSDEIKAITFAHAEMPATIDDLSKFVLIGRDKLQAVRAEISAIKKVGLASEVLEQKRAEAQEIAELVTLSEMRMGEMLSEIPKASGGDHGNQHTGGKKSIDAPFAKTKADTIADIGISRDAAKRYQQMAAHPEIVEQAIAEARENDDIVSRASVLRKIKESKKQEQRKEREERKRFTVDDVFPSDSCKLFVADIRDGLAEVADNSVDAVITDPPYPKEYIGLYRDLSRVSERVLKPGGVLIVMVGQSYLPDVIRMLDECMTYHWCLSYLTPGGQAPHLFQRNVNTFWKPVLWYMKGRYDGDCIGDVLKSDVNDNDKRFHAWGQSESGMSSIVERFTDPGDLILDPFLGGGTTGTVALATGRKFIGCDIDSVSVNTAEQRIRDAYER